MAISMFRKKRDKAQSKQRESRSESSYLEPVSYGVPQHGADQANAAFGLSWGTSAFNECTFGGLFSSFSFWFVTSDADSSLYGTAIDYRKVWMSGLSIQGGIIYQHKMANFHLNTTDAGPAEPSVTIRDPVDKEVPNDTRLKKAGLYECSFTPRLTGQHNIYVCFAGMNIKGSPFKVTAVESTPVVHSRKPADRSTSECLHKHSQRLQKSGITRWHTMQTPKRQPDILEMLSHDLRTRFLPLQIIPTEFQIGKILGQGQFGNVLEVRLHTRRTGSKIYAAKTLRDFEVTQLEEFFREAELMNNFRHPNVLALKGIVLWEDRPYILIPIMKHGCLKAYLERNKDALNTTALISFAYQVALAMEYVSELKFVHRDLAARNCLLHEDDMIKISDFGLARDNFRQNYVMLNKNKKLPIRWMAPEITRNWTFTTETDIWAYGVLIWEVFTFGREPYGSMDDRYLDIFLKGGNRLEKPERATDEIYDLMLACWKLESGKRPNFTSIIQHLKSISQKNMY